jgi:uncharacterized protein YbjT (DUF2867 family)
MKITIIGGTGLIGKQVIELACQDDFFTQITAVVRSPLPYKNRKINELIIDFDDLSNQLKDLKGHALICTLGTTRKVTPDKKAYRKIDLEYTLITAEMALKNGYEQIHLISSIGANEKSLVFYPALKGEIERLITQLSFKSTYIYRPSVLMGKRDTTRIIEYITQGILSLTNSLLIGPLKKYRGISANEIAKRILLEIKKNKAGLNVFESDEITVKNQ